MATVHLIGPRSEWTPRADPRYDERTSLGVWLRRAREARGLTLDGIARQTRIPLHHLEAIERGTGSALPPFYQRAEIRTFARAIGVDEQSALARLRPSATAIEPPRNRTPQNPAALRAAAHAVLAVGIILLAVAIVWRGVAQRAASTATSSTTVASKVAPKVVPRVASKRSAVTAPVRLAPPPEAAAAAEPVAPATTPPVAPATTLPVAAPDAPVALVPPFAVPDTITELRVTTEPEGARVTVNGIGWGLSPVAIRHLPPGDKRIRVSMDGYEAVERVLALDAGQPRSLDIQLATAP